MAGDKTGGATAADEEAVDEEAVDGRAIGVAAGILFVDCILSSICSKEYRTNPVWRTEMLFTAVAGILCAQQMAFDSVLKNSQPSLSASLRFTSTK